MVFNSTSSSPPRLSLLPSLSYLPRMTSSFSMIRFLLADAESWANRDPDEADPRKSFRGENGRASRDWANRDRANRIRANRVWAQANQDQANRDLCEFRANRDLSGRSQNRATVSKNSIYSDFL